MIVNHRNGKQAWRGREWKKAIPEGRDRMQSDLLAGAVGMVLVVKAALVIPGLHEVGLEDYLAMPRWFWIACGISAGFAAVVWLLRSATGPAAAMGGLVCLHVLLRQKFGGTWEDTAMPSLLVLFLLTFAATRFGRARKEAMGVAEGKQGRRAAQVLANLGAAAMLAAGGSAGSFVSSAMLAACVAALAEATADTVSSEMGQALSGTRWGGRTLLITTGKVVAAGTDGGVSVVGTACGAIAAAVVVGASPLAHSPGPAMAVFVAACAGLIFDSLLGATVERRGWLGNDLVNFSSTVFAAAVAWGLVALI
jgi:uncharacterized protein (TIGR00297 family)